MRPPNHQKRKRVEEADRDEEDASDSWDGLNENSEAYEDSNNETVTLGISGIQ